MSDSISHRDRNGDGHDGGDITEHTSHRPGAVRRTFAKVKNSTGLTHDTKSTYVDDRNEKTHPHPKVETLVDTVGFSLIQEIMQYLKGPEGEQAMEIIFNTQSRVAARLAMTDEAKRATRIAAQEAMTGTYDGAQRKGQEMWALFPPSLKVAGSIVIGSYLLLLSVGVLFSLWRFALFGLQ